MTKKKTSITLDNGTLKDLDEMADTNDRSRSGMIRQLIREAKKREEAIKTTKEPKETQDDSED